MSSNPAGLVTAGVPLGAASEVAVGVEQGAKYELVAPDGTRAVLNDRSDPDFVGYLTSPPAGIDSPEVRESADLLVEADGGVHGAFYFGRRPVTLEGIIDPTPEEGRDFREVETPAATNLVTNPSFEVDTAGWSTTGGGLASGATLTRTASTAPGVAGGFVGRVATDATSEGARIPLGALAAGAAYLVRLRLRRDTGGATLTARLRLEAAPNTELDVAVGVAPSATDLVEYVATVTPATSGDHALYVRADAATATTFDVDAVAVYAGADRGYFDGSTPGPAGFPMRSRWTGTAHASSSVLYLVERPLLTAGEVANKRVNRLQRVTRAMDRDLRLRWTAANGPSVELALRRQQPLRIAQRLPKTFLVALVAAEPRILRQSTSLGALTVTTSDTGSTNVRAEGNAPSPAVLTLRVPAGQTVASPINLRNLATGQTVRLNLSLTAADVLVVDLRARTVTVNGGNRYDAVDFAATDWWDLQPGDNPLRAFAGAGSGAAPVEVSYRDAWL